GIGTFVSLPAQSDAHSDGGDRGAAYLARHQDAGRSAAARGVLHGEGRGPLDVRHALSGPGRLSGHHELRRARNAVARETLKLHHETLWRAGGYALIVLVIILSLVPQGPQIDIKEGDKLGHFLAYGSLMFWFAQLAGGNSGRLRWAIAFVCMGIALEFVQG